MIAIGAVLAGGAKHTGPFDAVHAQILDAIGDAEAAPDAGSLDLSCGARSLRCVRRSCRRGAQAGIRFGRGS